MAPSDVLGRVASFIVGALLMVFLYGGVLGIGVELVNGMFDASHSYTEYVSRVIDGDTIELENGTVVRYIGVNAPETVDPYTDVECEGPEASRFNKELVEGKRVHVVEGVEATDTYGRTLAYIWVTDANGQTEFVNGVLVLNGLAVADEVGANNKYAASFLRDERIAKQHDRGMWSHCVM